MSILLLAESTPRARKDYQCDACRRQIDKACVHVKQVFVGDHGPYSFRFHTSCSEILDFGATFWGSQDEEYDPEVRYQETLQPYLEHQARLGP